MASFSESDDDEHPVVGRGRGRVAGRAAVGRAHPAHRGIRGAGTGRARGADRGLRGRGRGGRGRAAVPQFQLSDEDRDSGWVEFVPPVVEGQEYKYRPTAPDFTVRSPGPQNIPPNTREPIDFYLLFLTVDLLTTLVRETNRY